MYQVEQHLGGTVPMAWLMLHPKQVRVLVTKGKRKISDPITSNISEGGMEPCSSGSSRLQENTFWRALIRTEQSYAQLQTIVKSYEKEKPSHVIKENAKVYEMELSL